ncbi:MAG: FAD-binding oxidoreductase [Synechococcales bacterium]|nr:FAD-binding oxidoreductase [Synechococcales bacterium]
MAQLSQDLAADRVLGWDTIPVEQRSVLQAALHPKQSAAGLIQPQTSLEVEQAISRVNALGGTIVPCAGLSKIAWGGLIHSAIESPLFFLQLDRLNRLIDHAAADLTVTVEAGMKLQDLQLHLATQGQFLPIDPSYPKQATIGGMIATADAGAWRHRYNSIRDLLLGVSFVRADGQPVKAGGRVVKNVAGYDLMKLLTGSYGTLGVITEATLRVYPQPETSQTVILQGEATAIATLAQTLRSSALTPTALDLITASLAQTLGLAPQMSCLIRFQSMTESVTEQSQRVMQLGDRLGLQGILLSGEGETALWQQLTEKIAPTSQVPPILCKIGMKSSQAISLLQVLQNLLGEFCGRVHLGSGLGLVLIWDEKRPTQLLEARSHCQAQGGFLTVLQAPIALKQQMEIWGPVGNALPLMQAVKQQFDPKRRLSPHRFVGDI